MVRVLICDDHSLIREALAMTVRRCLPKADVVLCIDFPSSWDAALTKADLCICDLSMPGAKPIDGIRTLQDRQPDMRIIAISGSADRQTMQQVAGLGLAGIIPKTADAVIVETAIKLVLAGGTYISPNFDIALFDDVGPFEKFELTRVQAQVMTQLCVGRTNKEIGKDMEIAPSTVKTHVDNIFQKLGSVEIHLELMTAEQR